MAKSIAQQQKRAESLARLSATTPEQVQREIGTGAGNYRDVADWWDTMARFFKLTADEAATVKPAWVAATEQAEAADPVLAFVRGYGGPFEFLRSLQTQLDRRGRLSAKQYEAARKCYDREQSVAKSAPAAKSEPVAPGMYRTADGTIYKVQLAVHGSRLPYAKRLVQATGDRAWCFEYAPGAVRTLTDADRMTLDQAKEFGALYGTCCVCGATLTDENSIEAGIGPVCATKGEWA